MAVTPRSTAASFKQYPTGYDFKQEILGDVYDPNEPVLSFLRFKAVGRECDTIALAAELQALKATGFSASPDVMNSFWNTYKRAIQIWYGETYNVTHETHGVKQLLERCLVGEYAEVNELFAEFAVLTHTRGNMMLVPVYTRQLESLKTYRSFNRLRGNYDYWDLALRDIRNDKFKEFFSGDLVAPQFNLEAMPGGFDDFIKQNHLEAYVDEAGAVRPLWEGHLADKAVQLPQTKEDVIQFLANVCSAIKQREATLAAL